MQVITLTIFGKGYSTQLNVRSLVGRFIYNTMDVSGTNCWLRMLEETKRAFVDQSR